MISRLYFLLLLSLPIVAQVAPLDQSFDCTNTNYRVIYTACSAGDYSQCCAVGTDCCAGGCCPGGAYCVGQGTGNEKCCAASDSTDCGLVWLPDVICEGMDGVSSFACPHGSLCDQFADVCDAPAGGSSQAVQPTATQTAPVTATQPVPSTVVVPESTAQSAAPGTVTVVSTAGNSGPNAATTSGVTSVPVVTVSASPAATTTIKSVASSVGSFQPALALAALVLMCWQL